MAHALIADLSDAEAAELAQLLCEDKTLRQQWIAQVKTEGLLRACSGQFENIKKEQEVVKANAFFRRWKASWGWMAAAAALVLAAVLVPMLSSGQTSVQARVVEVADNDAFTRSQTVELSALTLTQGRLRLELPSGTRVLLTAPVTVRVKSSDELYLENGTLTVEKPEGAADFFVDTAHGRIEAAGRVVGISSRGSGTDVVAFNDAVKIAGRDGLNFTLPASEAVHLDELGAATRIPYIVRDINDVEWAWSSALTEDTVIAALSDNLSGSDAFYRISIGGMREGVPANAQRSHFWTADDGASFPSWLDNSDLMETVAQSGNAQYELAMSLSKGALVCVLVPQDVQPPQWLAEEGFSNSGVFLSMRDEDGRSIRRTAVWRKVVTDPQTVHLGAIKTGEHGGYTVATKVLSLPAIARSAASQSNKVN